jgi:hypothetical protein
MRDVSETLGQKQRRFCRDVAKLIEFAYVMGYELTFGEAWRTDAQAEANAASGAGISNSLHKIRLAIDLNLFKGGVYQTSSEAHRELGTFWKSLGSDYYWGGDFKDSQGRPKPDGNHYAIGHEGRK